VSSDMIRVHPPLVITLPTTSVVRYDATFSRRNTAASGSTRPVLRRTHATASASQRSTSQCVVPLAAWASGAPTDTPRPSTATPASTLTSGPRPHHLQRRVGRVRPDRVNDLAIRQ